MASDAEVIKEFLVSVGLKIDSSTLAKFDGFMASTAKTVFVLASALTAAATGIEVFVTTVADKMEDLYWSSQRLHDSVANIQDYALGIQNLGGSAEAARGSLESVMRLLRTNPGYGGLLAQLGINSKQGATGILEGLRRRFQHMPYYIAAQYAGLLGIDEATLWSMMQAKGPITGPGAGAGAFGATYRALGMDPGNATKAAHEFMVQLREMEAQFTVLAQAMAYDLLPVARRFTTWIMEFIKGTAIPWLKNLTPEKVQGWINQFDQIIVKLSAIADGLYKIMQFFGVIETPGGGRPIDPMDKRQQMGLPAAQQGDWNSFWAKTSDFFSKVGNSISGWASNIIRQQNLVEYFIKQGWSQSQAAGIVANLQYESGLIPNKRGDSGQAYGFGQWHADRQANFRRVFGHDITKSTPEEQAAFVQWELTHTERRAGQMLRLAKSAKDAALAMSRFYERPANVAASIGARAAIAGHLASINLHQKTDIHVNGTGSPHAVGREIAGHQGRVNGDLLRNLKPALQ